MFSIITFDFAKGDFDNWELPYDYHCVYILENGKDAYIGETTNVIKRADDHKKDPEKQKYNFKNIHIITGPNAESTPAHHYENLLVKLMQADGKFNVIDGNGGYKWNQYRRKNQFELYFDELWFLLEKKGLVKTKDFKSILNSEIYKYSPYTELNNEQTKTLKTIMHVLDSEETLPHDKGYKTRPILISGEAGTGKTLVAITLFNYLKNNEKYKDKKIALVFPSSTIREEVGYVLMKTPGLFKYDAISPIKLTKEEFDIIICDEAHKLRRGKNQISYAKNFKDGNRRLNFDNTHDELDWILAKSKRQILFYDKNQIVSPCEIPYDSFEKRLSERDRGIRPIKLKKQMRIQAGNGYVKYIYDILYQKTQKRRDFNNYDFKIISKYSEMRKIINEKEKNCGLSRLVSGYGLEFKNDGTKHAYDIYIDGVKEKWNTQTKGWICSSNSINEVGSIYTICGLDLNYIGVVIGPELYYDKENDEIKVNKDEFYDNVVKNGVSDSELLEYVLNTYGVLLTRAIKGTYIYVYNDELREYLKKFINFE